MGSLPLVGAAQTAPEASRFYVGAGASLLTDAPFRSYSSPSPIGPALTGGVQVSPRLALQVGAALCWQHETFGSTAYLPIDPNDPTVPPVYTSEYRARRLTVPLLARYTCTPPAGRFHVDALAGITLLHLTGHSTVSTTYAGQTDRYESDYAHTQSSVSLGPAVRYSLTTHLELAASAPVNAVIGDSYYRFSDRLFLNVLVGAHYTFGQR